MTSSTHTLLSVHSVRLRIHLLSPLQQTIDDISLCVLLTNQLLQFVHQFLKCFDLSLSHYQCLYAVISSSQFARAAEPLFLIFKTIFFFLVMQICVDIDSIISYYPLYSTICVYMLQDMCQFVSFLSLLSIFSYKQFYHYRNRRHLYYIIGFQQFMPFMLVEETFVSYLDDHHE